MPRPYPKFWNLQLPEELFKGGDKGLYDNCKVAPDYDELDDSWKIRDGSYFDVNGQRFTPFEVCSLLNLITGEEKDEGEDPYLCFKLCSCPQRIRAQLNTPLAAIEHLQREHGVYLCHCCGKGF